MKKIWFSEHQPKMTYFLVMDFCPHTQKSVCYSSNWDTHIFFMGGHSNAKLVSSQCVCLNHLVSSGMLFFQLRP